MEVPFADVDMIREHTSKDETFLKIMSYVRNGWPKNKKEVEQDVAPYYKVKDDISILKDVLLKNHQIIIPRSLRKLVLNRIHEGHMGVIRCQNLARQSVYWPNIYNDIENVVSSCEICLRHQNSNTRPVLMPHENIDVPWYKVGCDLFEFKGKSYILIVDYFSKFVEVELLNEAYSAFHVIRRLKSVFARHGIPFIVISDNGPPFNSKDFRVFCKDWGIEHKTSSPYLARSNGLAERTVQTVKKLLLKALENNSDPYIALLHYRTTPKGDLPSPSQLLMSRSLRTRVPSVVDNLLPRTVNTKEYRNRVESNLKKCSEYYNRKAVTPKVISEGEKIMFKKTPEGSWFHGEIIEVCREPRSYVVLDGKGSVYRRSLEHIRKSPRAKANVEDLSGNGNGEKQVDDSIKEDGQRDEIPLQNCQGTNNFDEQYVTRKGRPIRRPERLDL